MKLFFRSIGILLLVFCFCLSGCQNNQQEDQKDVSQLYNFHGRVIRVADHGALVQPEAGSNEVKSSDLIWVYYDISDIRVGDWVQVAYDGRIQETYPAQIPNVSSVAIQSRVLTDEILREIQAELNWNGIELFDFTQQNGVTVIGCKTDDEVGFVVLLKGDNGYSLEEVYKHSEEGFLVFSGVMESRRVYLVTDPDIYALEPMNENYDPIAIYNYPALIMPGVDTEFFPLRTE